MQLPPPIRDIARLDRRFLLRQCGNDETLAGDILRLLQRQLAEAVPALREGGASAQLAHALKGIARNVGAEPLARAAERLEAAPGDGPSAAALLEEVEALEAALRAAGLEAPAGAILG